MIGIFRAEPDGDSAVHNRLAQAQCDTDDAVQRLLGRHGIEVVGFRHSRKIRIETCPMLLPDHLLNDDRHLFFFEPVIRDFEVILCRTDKRSKRRPA